MIVTGRDPRALSNPLVAGEFGLQFYAGVPLTTRNGCNLGTLCVLDCEPRTMTESEVATLEDLAALVMNKLELRFESRAAGL
ncbi:GAF domain-containing protein [Pengzhenrongella sp.]|jgi:GAF domain-containing protein|uniref:GAF domain-containing protein n=1 Tax=Pengzhenrongella sp. TaxID=2888820 RepID=UPI002F93CAAB